jgi:HSP20 family protein
MTLARWNPIRELQAMQEDMDRLFGRLDGGMVRDSGGARQNWMLPLDVIEDENSVTLRAALPGLEPENIHVSVEDNVLTISGERNFHDEQRNGRSMWIESRYGSFNRSVTLPRWADTQNIDANYRNGVLELRVPRLEESKPRRIELKIGDSKSQPKAIEAPADTATQEQTVEAKENAS